MKISFHVFSGKDYQQPDETQHSSFETPEKVKQSQRDLEETTELHKSLRAASTIANDTKRMERVNARLESVTVSYPRVK